MVKVIANVYIKRKMLIHFGTAICISL